MLFPFNSPDRNTGRNNTELSKSANMLGSNVVSDWSKILHRIMLKHLKMWTEINLNIILHLGSVSSRSADSESDTASQSSGVSASYCTEQRHTVSGSSKRMMSSDVISRAAASQRRLCVSHVRVRSTRMWIHLFIHPRWTRPPSPLFFFFTTISRRALVLSFQAVCWLLIVSAQI